MKTGRSILQGPDDLEDADVVRVLRKGGFMG